jgi:hypothetical protein
MVLGIVPANRICMTRNVLLGFQAACQSPHLCQKVINGRKTGTLMLGRLAKPSSGQGMTVIAASAWVSLW